MGSVSGRNCIVHPERSAIALCRHCSKPVCSQCAIHAVAVDSHFCSEDCRKAALSTDQAKTSATPDRELVAGLRRPFPTGMKLWFRSLRELALRLAPVALLIGLVVTLGIDPTEAQLESDELGFANWAFIAMLVILAYGIALAGVIVSQRHTGYVHESSYLWALKRLIPWAATWVLVLAITMVGTLLLIVPGIYLGLRLFWADEYALIHGAGPIAALRESWKLTENEAGPIFIFQFLIGLFTYGVVIAWSMVLFALTFASEAIGLESRLIGFVFVWSVFMAYALVHSPEVARFYGMRASKSERARRVAQGKDAGPQFWLAD